MRERLEIAQTMDEYIGKYYSQKWLRKNVLSQTEEEMAVIDNEIADEVENGEIDIEEPFQPGQQQQNSEPEQTEESAASDRLKTIKLVNSNKQRLDEEFE